MFFIILVMGDGNVGYEKENAHGVSHHLMISEMAGVRFSMQRGELKLSCRHSYGL
jgi:hypothetical protein